jgi:hypothetical protein
MIFEWAVQFQGNTVKLNCYARDYEKSTCQRLPSEVMADFKALQAEHGLRGPNPGRTKAYVSLSKKLNFAWSDTFAKIVEAHASAHAELSGLGWAMARAHGVEGASLSNPSAPIQA